MQNFFIEKINGLNVNGVFEDSLLHLHQKTIEALKSGRLKIDVIRTARARTDNIQKIQINAVWGAIKIIIDSGNNTISMGEDSGGRFELNFYRDNYFSLGKKSTCNDGRFIFNDSNLEIGQDCMISDRVLFQLSDEHGIVDIEEGKIINSGKSSTLIGDHAWIGRNATIMHGITIGLGSIVGAGAIVTRDVPPKSLCVGVPARVIRNNVTWSRSRDALDDFSARLIASYSEADAKSNQSNIYVNHAAQSRKPEFEVWTNTLITQEAKNGYAVIRKHYPPFPVRSEPINWKSNPLADKTWRLYFCSISWLIAFSHDREFIKSVLESCLEYSLVTEPDTDPDFWDDHAISYRASYISYLTTSILDRDSFASPDFCRKLVASIEKHKIILTKLIANKRWDLSNHRIFQCEGLIDLAIAFFRGTEREQLLQLSIDGLRKLASRTITLEEGSVKEHAMFYHVFIMGRLKETEIFLQNNLINSELVSRDAYSKLFEFILLSSPKPRTIFGIGDTKHFHVYDPKFTKHFNDNRYMTSLSKMILSHETFPERVRLFEYKTDGYSIFRSSLLEDCLLSVKLDKPFVGPHGHWDALSFCLSKNGCPIFIDAGGPYKYGSPLRYKYFQTQLAHNTVILNNRPVKAFSKVIGSGEIKACAYSISLTELDTDKYLVRFYLQHADRAVVIIDIPLGKIALGADAFEARFHLAPTLKLNTDNEIHFDEAAAIITFARNEAPLVTIPNEAKDVLKSLNLFQEFENYDAATISQLPEDYANRSFITLNDGAYIESVLLQARFKGNETLTTTIKFNKTNSYHFDMGLLSITSPDERIVVEVSNLIGNALNGVSNPPSLN